MRTMKNLALAAMAATALALAGCGGGGSGGTASAPTTPTEPTMPTKAAMAAEAAKMSSGAAATSAATAATAVANLATLQTGEMAAAIAAEAQTAADAAMAAYEMAKAEAAKSDAATDVTAAVEARIKAEQAAEDAANAAEMADMKSMEAVAAAAKELMIVGTMKSVGGMSIDAMAPNKVVTTDGVMVNTGLQADDNPEHTVAAVTGVDFVAGDGSADPPVADTAYVQAVAARTFDIGKVVDSEDDMARLTLVTSYATTKMVDVFALQAVATRVDSTHVSGSRAGKIFVHNGADGTPQTDDDIYVTLHDAGMFYLVDDGNDDGSLAAGDILGATTKPVQVYSYTHLGDDGAVGGTGTAEDEVRYAIRESSVTTEATDTTVITYRQVDIMAPASDATTQGTAEEVRVKAALPMAMDYDHIHFGVWANLKGSGSAQTIDGLGIGFVQSIGDGMTAGDDMPNHGSATYDGNWVAAVQEANAHGNGAVTIETGESTLTADFEDGDVMVALTGLATLEGDIAGGMFSGDEATVATDNTHNLTGGEDFTGSFSGGFYGAGAREAGGVFDFASDDNEAGAFRGAFGGRR